MSSLGERVRNERKDKKWSQQQLAEEVTKKGFKIGQSAIGNIESRGGTEPKCIVQLAAALELSVTWLQTGKGQKTPMRGYVGSAAASPASQTPTQQVSAVPDAKGPPIPVWAAVAGGNGGAMILSDAPIDRLPRRDETLSAFAVFVLGNSMSPAIDHGDQAIVEPDLPLRPGNDCVFVADDGHGVRLGLVKRLLREHPDRWRVRQFNPPDDFDLPKKKWAKAFRITGKRYG